MPVVAGSCHPSGWEPHPSQACPACLTLRAVTLLPGGRGLACPAIGSTGHDPAAPLAGTWLSWCLAFAVPRFSPFNFHLDKRSSGLGRRRGSWTPCPQTHPQLLMTTLSILLQLKTKYLTINPYLGQ